MFNYPIAISLSPNTEIDDVLQAIRTLLQPWMWKEGSQINKVERWFCEYFGVKSAVSFNSGRSALYALLNTFEIGEGDEVIIQAFTCVAVADPILWAGAKPVFVDIDESLNIDYRLIERKITDKTKAIIVQHTFGVPANLDKITKIAQKHNILLIEDCAHSLGAKYEGKKLGSIGDAAFFSFGRDKVISSVFGGIAIINSTLNQNKYGSGLPRTVPCSGAGAKLREIQNNLGYPSYIWILQQVLHPIAFAIILPLYNLIVGKIILFILINLRILSKPVYIDELTGRKPKVFPFKYPNALAILLLKQLIKLEVYNDRRRKIADFYYKNLIKNENIVLPQTISGSIYLRFNMLMRNAQNVIEKAKKDGVILGNWYHNIIDPNGVEFEKIGYSLGSCKKAEDFATQSINLPTYPRLNEDNIKRVIKLINEYVRN